MGSFAQNIIEYPDEFGFAGCLSTLDRYQALGVFASSNQTKVESYTLMPFMNMLKKYFNYSES